MLAALSIALLGLAEGPATAAQQAAPAEACPAPNPNSQTIVICTQRSQGYRLNPDVMMAKREMHNGGRPVRPNGTPPPDCATVGPNPCVTAGIPIVGAALTAIEMAQRLAKGEEVGSMFVTDPHPTEYQLYQMAKEQREAKEQEKAALAKLRPKADLHATVEAQPPGSER